MFRFFSDFGGETAPRPSPEIAENREKSKKLRSGQRSLLLEVLGKGFGMIFDGFGERSEGMLRHGVQLFKAKHSSELRFSSAFHSLAELAFFLIRSHTHPFYRSVNFYCLTSDI